MVIRRSMRWFHTCWPAGTGEELPGANDDLATLDRLPAAQTVAQ